MPSSEKGTPGERPLSIGEVAERFGLPVSTIRYYDKCGLFPSLERRGGQRRFGQEEVEALRIIECLKASGLSIERIARFMEAVARGPETYGERKALFEECRSETQAELERIQEVLAVLDYKCWYYGQLVDGACEQAMDDLTEADVPEEYRRGWRHIHDELT